MKLGLYRMVDRYVGECARTDRSAGDAAPFLPREIYQALHFEPRFDDLPTKEQYEAQKPKT